MNGGAEPDCSGGGCEEALAQLEAYLDGELPGTTKQDIESHLRACYPCTDRASFEEQLRAIVRDGCTEQVPDRLVDRIRLHLDVSSAAEDG